MALPRRAARRADIAKTHVIALAILLSPLSSGSGSKAPIQGLPLTQAISRVLATSVSAPSTAAAAFGRDRGTSEFGRRVVSVSSCVQSTRLPVVANWRFGLGRWDSSSLFWRPNQDVV